MEEFKLITLNIRHGTDNDGKEALFKQAELLSGFDIALVQEVDLDTTRNPGRDLLKELSHSSGLKFYTYGLWHPYQGGRYGVGILSRYELFNPDEVLLPMIGSGESRDTDGKVRSKLEQRGILLAEIKTEEGLLRVGNTHSSLWASERSVSDLALYLLLKYSSMPIVVGGDLNINSEDEYINTKKFNEISPVNALTYPANRPIKGIDKLFGNQIEVIESWVCPQEVSDHRAVAVKFKVKRIQ